MGTDVHFYLERRGDSGWEAIGEWVENDFYDPDEPGCPKLYFQSAVHVHQNYALFAILANVRNLDEPGCLGWLFGLLGFPRKRSESAYIPISDPRGLPDDLSPDLKKMASFDNQVDFHSWSWLMLREILDYDWDKPVTFSGKATDQYPGAYLDKKADPPMLVPRGRTKVDVQVTPREEASEFLEEVVPKLQEYGNPDEIRVVFWFDN